jgi:pimeloyl-ACP methyl ester carboxylesterase
MEKELKTKGKFEYVEVGEGKPLILLHGLMGALSNFEGIVDYFSVRGYKVIIPSLPIYKLPVLTTNVKNIASFVKDFIKAMGYEKPILLGNSLGGHVALIYALKNSDKMGGMVLTGSSGLYEKAFGESFPRREDKSFIKRKTQEVFFDPEIATDELVEDVYQTINDRGKLIRILAIAKSAIRHNMSKDLPKITVPTCLIWGRQDSVTPPEVAIEFNEKLPNAALYWIDKCGHAPMMEHPDEFNRLLDGWLQTL